MLQVVAGITNAMIHVAAFPDFCIERELFLYAIGKSSLYELHRSFQSDAAGRQDEVNVVRHHNKFVKQEFLIVAIMKESIDEQIGEGRVLKQRSMSPGTSGHEIAIKAERGLISWGL
jgi:hypothetical protein